MHTARTLTLHWIVIDHRLNCYKSEQEESRLDSHRFMFSLCDVLTYNQKIERACYSMAWVNGTQLQEVKPDSVSWAGYWPPGQKPSSLTSRSLPLHRGMSAFQCPCTAHIPSASSLHSDPKMHDTHYMHYGWNKLRYWFYRPLKVHIVQQPQRWVILKQLMFNSWKLFVQANA